MTRRDYVLIAEAIKAARTHSAKVGDDRGETAYLIGWFQVMLKSQNPRFDAEQFATACQVERCKFCNAIEGVTSHAGGCSNL